MSVRDGVVDVSKESDLETAMDASAEKEHLSEQEEEEKEEKEDKEEKEEQRDYDDIPKGAPKPLNWLRNLETKEISGHSGNYKISNKWGV